MEHIIPKEYMLEKPGNYDEIRVRKEINALINTFSLETIIEDPNYLHTVFNDIDHLAVANDILCYIIDIDIDEYDVYDKFNQEKLVKRFVLGLMEAGFFG